MVAQEVRELAQRSATAAREIKQLISSSSAQVQKGVTLVHETGFTLDQIISDVAEIDRHVAAIAAAAGEQSLTLGSINEAVAAIDRETQNNAAMAEQSAAAGNLLVSEAEALTSLLAQFKIVHEESAPVSQIEEEEGAAQTIDFEASGRMLHP